MDKGATKKAKASTCPNCKGATNRLRACKTCGKEKCVEACFAKYSRECVACPPAAAGPTEKIKPAKTSPKVAAPAPAPTLDPGKLPCIECLQPTKSLKKCVSCGAEKCAERCMKKFAACPACRKTP